MSRFYLLVIILCFSIKTKAQKLTVEANPVPGVTAALLNQQFEDYEVVQIDLRQLNREVLKEEPVLPVRFHFGKNKDWDVRLIPNDIRSEGYQLQATTEEGRFRPSRSRNKTFVGHITNEKGGAVRLTIDRNFIYGFFKYNGEAYFIEPLRRFVENAAADEFLFYKASDVNPAQGRKCAVNEIKEGLGKDIHQESEAAEKVVGLCYEVEIALAADYLMFDEFGSVTATENQMLGILNLVQTNYDDDFDDEIVFQVVTVFVATSPGTDPWSGSSDAGVLLNSFANWGNNGGFGASYDVATLWTDRNLAGTTIGVAWPGSLCTSQRYNVCENFNSNASLLRVLQAHELGHNFNASHDGQGAPTIMAPSVSNTNTWSAASQADISNYIAVVGSGGGCFTSCAPAAPPVATASSPVNNVCPGSVVPFFDNSTNNPTSWSWNFPGGTPSSSNQQNPTVVYDSPGNYTAILTVENDVGVDATSVEVTVTDAGTKYLVYETFELGPANFVVDNPDGAITWAITNVGGTPSGNRAMYVNNYDYDADGQKDALVSVPFDFTAQSNIMLEMDYAYRRYNNNLKDILRILISVDGGNTFPFTAFEGDENGSGNFATAPDSQSPFTPAIQNDWCFGSDFGAECISIDLSSLAGESNVVIKIENETGFGNNLFVDNLRILTNCEPIVPPVAAFTASIQEGCVPLEVNFESLSTGDITNYNWSFPGGIPSFSSLPNPTVTYNFSGVYDVILVVGNSAGNSTAEEFAYINIQGEPTVDFAYEVDELTVLFENLAIDGNSYLWDFGDGNSSTVFNPNHTYAGEGEYTVTLTVTNECGTVSLEQTVTVSSPLSAAFAASTTSGCADLQVAFTDNSIGNIDNWAWTFEGGTPATSTEQNPVVTYQQSGTYSVTLTVSNAVNQMTIEEVAYIMVEEGPSAGFDITTSLGQSTVGFTNTSTNAVSYQWDFGDGSTSSELNPNHTYTMDGTYTVQLTALNDCGEDIITQEVTILSPPEASFTSSETTGCAPFTVTYNAEPTGDGLTYAWTFEGGTPLTSTSPNPTVTYNNVGQFGVSLTVGNAAGADTYEETSFVEVGTGPIANFDISSNLGEVTASFTNMSTGANSYHWDFGDGDESNATNPSHTYTADGSYTVQLIAINECGNDTSTQELTILRPPVAGFTSSETTGCAPFTVTYHAQPMGEGVTFAWTFEGGTPLTSTSPNPTVTYTSAGQFGVSLTVSNAAGSDTFAETTLVEVNLEPTAGFGIDYTVGNSYAQFDNTASGAQSYLWDFGDGSTSMQESPTHEFNADGTFTIMQIVENDCGTDTLTQEITIITPPKADFQAAITTGCAPLEVQFTGQSEGPGAEYAWTFIGGTPTESNSLAPTVVYETAGVYSVMLIVSNAAGTDTAVVENYINVEGLPTAAFTSFVNGFTVQVENNSDAGTFAWDFGDGNSSSEPAPVHVYETEGNFEITLTVTNDCGSVTISEMIEINVDFPTADFVVDITDGCAPLVVQFESLAENSDSLSWSFPGGTPQTSSAITPVVTYAEPGTFNVTLEAFNEFGNAITMETALIQVGGGPAASFDFSVSETMVLFENNSENATDFSWDFGDGNMSAEADPMHVFPGAGTYLVQLVATNACGNDTLNQEVVIEGMAPVPAIMADAMSGCIPFTVDFTDLSEGDPTAWLWTFEGGNPMTSTEQHPTVTYDQAGSFEVSLQVTNAFGTNMEVFTDYISILDQPTASFDYELENLTVHFESLTTGTGFEVEWQFGDGTTSEALDPIHTYDNAGVYEAMLIARNECGSDTITQVIELIIDQVEQPDWVNQFELFPNPNNGQFSLLLEGATQTNLKMQLINVVGQVLYQDVMDFGAGYLRKRFDFGALPAGMYLLQLQSGDRYAYKKVIVQ